MTDKVLKAIADFSMLHSGDRVVVALSGGADSVALLYVLNSIKEKYNLTLYACHLNHLIRGDEADADEQFVVGLCDKLGIELYVRRVDVKHIASEQKISVELCGRNERYAFFDELSKKLDAKVATAHTASDNVETVLYNMTRGTSITGLCGIKPVRDYIIRPLIDVSRQEVEQYCSENNIEYVTDSTNLSDDYTRNAIRHHAVAPLQHINPNLCNSVSRMCSDLTDIKEFIDKYSLKEINRCKNDYGYNAEHLLSLERAILTNSMYLIAKDSGTDAQHTHIELMISILSDGGCVDLPDGKRAVCKQGVFRIVDICDDTQFVQCPLMSSVYARYISKEELKSINKKLLNNCINCDIITQDTVIRTRKEGDSFTLCDRDVTKSLKKLLNELKIPAEKRSGLKLVANGSTVLWLEGVGVSKQGRCYAHSSGAYLVQGDKND